MKIRTYKGFVEIESNVSLKNLYGEFVKRYGAEKAKDRMSLYFQRLPFDEYDRLYSN